MSSLLDQSPVAHVTFKAGKVHGVHTGENPTPGVTLCSRPIGPPGHDPRWEHTPDADITCANCRRALQRRHYYDTLRRRTNDRESRIRHL